jgi:glycosyltransferase involved in cell wall biosynthesis
MHAHNTFPLISPSIFRAARGTARVLTLHNYRLFCAEATTTRDAQSCDKCLVKKSSLPSVWHACYGKSRLATIPVAASISLHRRLGTWRSEVDAFVALTDFQRGRLVGAGLEQEKVHVKPNFISGIPSVVPWREREDRVVYAGRITPEKGVEDLVSAWIAWGSGAPELFLVGDGPQRAALESKIRRSSTANIRFMGQLDALSTQELIGRSRLLVLPSLVSESFGLPIIEGFARGTPALVSDRGPLRDIAGAGGCEFHGGDSNDLLSKVQRLWKSPEVLEEMGSEGRCVFIARFTEDENYRQLMQIYDQAIENASRIGS